MDRAYPFYLYPWHLPPSAFRYDPFPFYPAIPDWYAAWSSRDIHDGYISAAGDGSRQTPAHAGGPERITERHPKALHVEWHARYPNDIILAGPTRRKEVALTFDDGPDDVWTPQVLSVLSQYNVKATFMCVGHRVQMHPRQLRLIQQEGHVIGNHSWSHPNFTKISITEVRAQVERTSDEIQRIVGVRPRFFRPPYGALNDEVIREVVRMGYKILLWNVDSLDWARLTGPQVAANVLAHTTPGSIILMHSAGGVGESLADTVQALPYIILTLQSMGYTFRSTVSELLNMPAYQPAAQS